MIMHEQHESSSGKLLNDWQWFYRTLLWPSKPETYEAFWTKVESSTLLKLLCDTPNYEDRWKDALMFHLSQMWMAGPVHGRLELGHKDPSMWVVESISMLDLIVRNLMATTTVRSEIENVETTLLLIKHFFPNDVVATNMEELSDKIARLGNVTEEQLVAVVNRAADCRMQINERKG